ncbi:protein irg-1-like [Brevipalpus obovatus]|uniref:protein irg-1-like n=1 Tax=Brevipalpus obovatus TaxID=246614 RepID=UPI003D9E4BA0
MAATMLISGEQVLPVTSKKSRKTFFLFPTHLHEFISDSDTFICLEQYIQYQKAKYFEDFEAAQNILSASSVKEIQKFGSKIRGFNTDSWAVVKFSMVGDGIFLEFSQNKSLAKKLARTSGYYMAWCGFLDKYWSCGLPENDPSIYHPPIHVGKNNYGLALMNVRNELCSVLGNDYEEWYREGMINSKYYPQNFVISRLDFN